MKESEINGKTRLLYLLRLLYRKTDEQHPITTAEICTYFKEQGVPLDRKTVKTDVDVLIALGYDIVVIHSTQNLYFAGTRMFELPELKLLIDAVESSKFITKKKSVELTEKLSALASEYQATELKRGLYIVDWVKPKNEQIYYFVDYIHTAVNSEKQISFRYFEYDANRKRVFRNEGRRYRFSPYGLLWNEDRYYVVGYSEKHDKIATFRVDRMAEVSVLDEDAIPPLPNFSLPEFARQVFDMYDGQMETVTLRCKNEMMKVILDRFGDSVKTHPLDCAHFQAETEVSVSKTFLAWIFQFCGEIKIVRPRHVLERYREMLEKSLK